MLNRIAFGPRPGDIERVQAMGLDRYIDQQLHPERLPDRDVEPRLAPLTTLRMSSRAIAETIEQPQIDARKAKKAGEEPTPADRKANSVVLELSEQKVLRAIYSERQLQEVLTDFWFNHFNVDARKGPVRFMLPEYERDVIRPRVLGKFRDLLEADAKSPAMLFYLDNWMSADPNGPHAPAPRPRVVRGPFGPMLVQPPPRVPPKNPNAPKGLNENYARELMELHTLGVDGGYTQKDVTEVARCFTGWTIDRPRAGGGFVFRPALHDAGQKIVLGHVIKAGGGESDGEQVLDILAKHPSTARFIATALARRFVGDVPPPALVDRAAKRFRDTDGDLREVVRTILASPEFLAADAVGAKMKTPFEFVVSALRATGADVQDATPIVRTLQQLGMPLYQCQPPTGYKETADAWVNTGALVDRMNFAVRLANQRLNGVAVAVDEPPDDLALRIGGPDFQKR
ncbi:MAG TPA: DUF1800 domain-containing protein [Vicinamibacterales bacterium]|nr:DUF1800 domain-containing protein [Vicinamibacterales bacterium]